MIADKIRALRESKGITQTELAKKLFLTRAGVNSWEQGLSTPSPSSIVDIANYFGVSTDYLLGIEKNATIDVSGLGEKDVAILVELVQRLKNK